MSYLGFLMANLGRKPVRTWLTFLSIVVCFLLFGLLRTVGTTFTEPPSLSGVERLVVAPKYSIIHPLPISHMNALGGVEGVAAVTHANRFGGSYQDYGTGYFAIYPVRPREYFDIYSEFTIPEDQLEAFENTRTGAVSSRSLAEQFGWKLGDMIPIVADIYPKEDGSLLWEFELVGLYERPGGAASFEEFFFHYDYFEQATQHSKGMVGWFMVRMEDANAAAEVASSIDAFFENSLDPTRTMTEKEYNLQFMKQLGDIGFIVRMILTAVFFSILLLVGNTMFQSFKERMRDLGVLKALGFSDGQVARIIMFEAMMLTLGGALVGLCLAALLLMLAEPWMRSLGVFRLDALSLAMGIAAALALGFVVGAVPATRAGMLPIVDVLRGRA